MNLENEITKLKQRVTVLERLVDDNQSLSKAGANFIAAWEGERFDLYNDVAGYPTIGIGHLVRGNEIEQYQSGITEEESRQLFRSDIEPVEAAINRYVEVPLTQYQFDALVSFTFNVGVSAFAKSTLLKRLNAGRYDDVPVQLGRWKYAGGKVVQGLVNRRTAEGDLFVDGIYSTV